MSERYRNYIAGEWSDSISGKTFDNRNPAKWDEIVGVFPDSNEDDVNRAVTAAREAFKEWSDVPAPIRGNMIKKAGDILVERKEEIAKLMTREMGKVLIETRGDVQEGIDTAYYSASEGRRMFGHTAPSELRDKYNIVIRRSVGPAGIITPWNFPLAIPTWKIFPALTTGNTVVFKPASDTPATATVFVEVLVEAGIPPGVINIVHGGGSNVGTPIVEHPDIKLISFTGSSAVGKIIASSGGQKLKRVSLELGGKNAQIVLNDADVELATEGAVWGAFGTTGQRCTATSRLIVQDKIYGEFIEALLKRVDKLKLGDGLDESVEVGPIVNEAQRESIHEYVGIGKEEGATLSIGGEFSSDKDLEGGWFYQPTIFENVDKEMRIAKEEIFGPVLCVLKFKEFDEAIDICNNVDYGLSSSIYTRDVNKAFMAVKEIDAGITYINGPTIGAECHMPFGGCKDTGNGHREGGYSAFEFFTEEKTVYVDFSGKLQRAQIDTEA
ncbi:MAG: aldehyde dehydrogenase family protein [Candidatus Marinimicrobia bacterium]|nr:aldehyde dehydrogenase family protein [Candidatus Neomarinimicrobiota bacterium]